MDPNKQYVDLLERLRLEKEAELEASYKELDKFAELVEATNLISIGTKKDCTKDRDVEYSYCLQDDSNIILFIKTGAEGFEPFATPYEVGRIILRLNNLEIEDFEDLEYTDVYSVERKIKLLALKISVENKFNQDSSFFEKFLRS